MSRSEPSSALSALATITPRKHRQAKPDAKRNKRRAVENDAFRQMLTRLLRALGRRVRQGDPDDLRLLATLRDEVDGLLREAITAQREDQRASWAVIGRHLGISKQSAQERFGGSRR